MSAESAILVEVRALREDVRHLAARLDAAAPSPWPDRLSTAEAVAYVRAAYDRPKFSARTLRRWAQEGSLTVIAQPRRWLRSEIDLCCGGRPISAPRGAA